MIPSVILILILSLSLAASGQPDRPTALARLSGSGADSTQFLATDKAGNIFAAGTTLSPDFPVTLNAAQAFMADSNLVHATTAGGSWSKVPNAIPFLQSIAPDPSDPMTLFATSFAGIYRSKNGGSEWRLVKPVKFSQPLLGSTSPTIEMGFDPSKSSNVYAHISQSATSLGIAVSSDGGESWQDLPSPITTAWLNLSRWFSVGPDGRLYLGAFQSDDHGQHWTNITAPSKNAYTVIPDPWRAGRIYALSISGDLWVSNDNGISWPINSSVKLNGLAFDPDLAGVVYGLGLGTLQIARDPNLT